MSHFDEHPFDDAGFTPELTKAMEDLSTVNTSIMMIDRVEREIPEMLSPELEALRDTLRDMSAVLVINLNELLKREQVLRRGL